MAITVRFNPETDEFGALTRDGRIRTYYRPDPKRHGFPTNLDYFNFEKEESSE
jgi:pyocin large subunit-like protein